MPDSQPLESRIARHQLAIAFVLAGLITNAADVWVTLQVVELETNPIVLALGWESWVAVKAAALVGLIAAWWIGREHRFSTAAAAGPAVVGLVGLAGNAPVLGWHLTDAGQWAIVALAGSVLVVAVGVIGVDRLVRRVDAAITRSRPIARRAAPAAIAVLMVTSTMGGLALVGTQPADESSAGIASAQASSGDLIYSASSGGAVRAIDSETGDLVWEDTSYERTATSIEFDSGENRLYATGRDEGLRVYDATSGELQWSNTNVSGQLYSVKLLPSGEHLVVGNGNGDISYIDVESRSIEWSINVDSDIIDNMEISQDGSTAYIGSRSGNARAIDLSTQSVEWTNKVSEYNLDGVALSGTGELFVGGSGGQLKKLNPSNGSAVWSSSAASTDVLDLAVSEGTLYAGIYDGHIRAVNTTTGSQVWSKSASNDVESVAVSPDSSIVYSAPRYSNLTGYSTDTQSEVFTSTETGGYVLEVEASSSIPASSGGSPDLNGTVSTQTNDGVANATVQLTMSKEPSIPQADTQLDELSNPIPAAYEEQIRNGFDLLGGDGYLENNDGAYAAIYDPSDLGLTYQASADLSEPKVTNIEPGEEQALIISDTEASCGVLGFETNEYNQQIPGCVQPEGNVTIEKLSGTGEVVATDSVSVEEAGNQRDFGGPTNVHYATYTFAEGIYRVSAETEDGDGISYLTKAGNPTPDFNRYARNVEGAFTSQTESLRDAIDQDLLEVKTVTTNETGYWEASVPDNAKLVTVSARKAPGVAVDPANLTYENMSDAYNAEDSPNASVYLPSRTKRVSPPAQNVDVTLREVAFPGFADMDRLQTRLQELKNKLNNLTMDDLPQQLLQRMETESRDDLANAWGSLRGTLVNYEPAREAYLEISDREEVPTADELSKSELQAAIQNANVAITRSSSTGQLTEMASETTEDTISQTWELVGIPLDQANVSVVADYSNGTSRVVDDEYIETSSGIVGADTISVEEFPLGEDDPEQVSFRLRVAGADEFASKTTAALNPTFSGEVPSIDAVEVTSLQPGPDDRVTVEVHPDSESTFRGVEEMTVRGPDGETIATSNISDGTTASFTTDGAGVHSIRFTIESTSGDTFTDVVQIEAADTDETLRPSIYAHSGPLGTYALVGDGFESGDVETTSTGSIEIVGQLGNDAEVPNTVDVFAEGVDVGTESATTVRIVRGESRQGVRANVPIVFHTPMLNSPDDARSHKTLVRANGNPVAWDGSTRYGVVEQDNDGASIRAFTADNGVLTLSLDNTPSWWERTNFSWDTNYPWLPLTAGASPLLGGFVVASRRSSN